jgi:hypothetical protein
LQATARELEVRLQQGGDYSPLLATLESNLVNLIRRLKHALMLD